MSEKLIYPGFHPSWDGRFHGKMLNAGVFTYKMMVVYKDGMQEVRYGDLTIVRKKIAVRS